MARSRMTGATRLRRKLRRFPEDTTAEVKTAIAEAAESVHAQALGRVPVDTGTLARNLSYRVSKDGLEARVGVLGARAKREAYYAGFVEFGTSRKPARPYLRPALEEERVHFRPRINTAVNRAVAKMAQDRGGD